MQHQSLRAIPIPPTVARITQSLQKMWKTSEGKKAENLRKEKSLQVQGCSGTQKALREVPAAIPDDRAVLFEIRKVQVLKEGKKKSLLTRLEISSGQMGLKSHVK
ncbi:hypothetical protein D8674_000340 [Pyrus ussuriensis x Pyrus communis]|uniref:Uncharacterized protein n=1 Tax=Pyrus ussuriensis x Pyrus communis TaxID=2448454 RepID=A0A5N5F8J9_9ROSA|nr:hypothetical protein D8674_000340 [Pyrus ussuriensis x Pyrus communis]